MGTIRQAGSAEREEDGPRFGGVFRRLARLTNPLAVRLAGKRWLPLFAVIRHVGRRSGRTYETPVAARRVEDGFVIALAFGEQADWYRNLQACGGATIRWRGVDYPVIDPESLEPAAALATFNPIQRIALRLGGIGGYIRLRDASPAIQE